MYDCNEEEIRFGQPINGKLLVVGKSAAGNFVSDKPWACISIGTEPGDWPKINKCQLVDLLQISFFDLDRMPELPETLSRPEKIVLFNDDHAKQIWGFVGSVWDRVDLLLIHCLAGVSRSPAVAAAIAKIKYDDDSLYFNLYTPNMLVYRTMMNNTMTKEDLIPGTLENPKEFGIFDTKEKLWMGSPNGPLTYSKHVVAQICSQLMGERLALPIGRLRAMKFTGANTKLDDIQAIVPLDKAFARVLGEE
jgi:hypothetical protein